MQALRDGWDSLLSEPTLVATKMDDPSQFNKEHSRQRKRRRFHDGPLKNRQLMRLQEQHFGTKRFFFIALDNIISDLDTIGSTSLQK